MAKIRGFSPFQQRLTTLSPREFEEFAASVLPHLEQFKAGGVGLTSAGDVFDLVATDREGTQWFFEVKRSELVGADLIDRLVVLLEHARRTQGKIRLVLFLAGHATRSARRVADQHGIEIWDGAYIERITPPSVAERFVGSAAQAETESETSVPPTDESRSYEQALADIQPGSSAWAAYQELIAEIFQYLFQNQLQPPRYEHSDNEGRNRRDMIFENSSPDGFWAEARRKYTADYIVVDAKNYTDELPKDSVLSIAHYLKSYGCGMFGLLVCRRGPSEAAKHAIREQWIGGGKMIVCLSDSDIGEMLALRASGGRPEELIRSMIADFRMSL